MVGTKRSVVGSDEMTSTLGCAGGAGEADGGAMVDGGCTEDGGCAPEPPPPPPAGGGLVVVGGFVVVGGAVVVGLDEGFTTTISGSSVIEIVTDPSTSAVPSKVTCPFMIAYVFAPARIVEFVIVIDNGLPVAVDGTVPSAANQATTRDTMKFPSSDTRPCARDKSFTKYTSITVLAGRPSAGYRNDTELDDASAENVLPTPLTVVIVPILGYRVLCQLLQN